MKQQAILDNKLIENALALCEYMYDDMEVVSWVIYQKEELTYRFSIEKFCYYLLERHFLIKYYQNQNPWYMPSTETTDLMAGEFWYAIMEYQSGNEKPLIELLSKIWLKK